MWFIILWCFMKLLRKLITFVHIKGFRGGIVVKNPPTSAGDPTDMGPVPGSGRPPGVGNSNPLQYSCLENPMDRGDRQATGHGGHKMSWTQLSDWAGIQVHIKGLPWSLRAKESACRCRRCGFNPLVKRPPGVGNGNPLQYSCLESPMDRGSWWATAHGVCRESDLVTK